MKKLLSLLTTLAIALSLCACTQTPPETVPATTVPETTVPETTVPTEPTEAPCLFADYEYRYEEGRDRKWEEDIVYLARCYLGLEMPSMRHPRLMDQEVGTAFGNTVIIENLFDQAIYDAFCQELLSLIDQIPALRDEEVFYGAQKAVALLNDGHSTILEPNDWCYFTPLTELIADEEGIGVYLTGVPKELEAYLMAKLTAINGVPVDEAVEKLVPYLSSDSPYLVRFKLFTAGMLMDLNLLQMAGLVGWEEDTAEFTVVTRSGEETSFTTTALPLNTHGEIEMICQAFASPWEGHGEADYWAEYRGESVYIRINQFKEDSTFRYSDLAAQIDQLLENNPQKLIVDLRHNPGGTYGNSMYYFVNDLCSLEVPETYVLIDDSTYSAAVMMASNLRQQGSFQLAGTPAGQAALGFGNFTTPKTPNHKIPFTVALKSYRCWKGGNEDALMPDVEIHQTLDDKLKGVDTVMEAVLNENRK